MDPELSYLEDYLREEFRNHPEIRIRLVLPSGTRRSIDLEQDYDKKASNLHRICGVSVFTSRSEYFFPKEWIKQPGRLEMNALIEKIRGTL